MIDSKYFFMLSVAAIVAVIVSFATTPNGGQYLLVYSLAVGIVASYIFYLLVVYVPEFRRRRIITRAFVERFKLFRLNCINNFLILSNSQEYKDRENLLVHEEFKRYFRNNNKFSKNRWYEVANGLQDKQYYLDEIIYELQMFNKEIKFVRNSIYLHDVEVFEFLNQLSQAIHRLERVQPEYDSIKSFSRDLWSIFTGWSWAEGYKNADYIERMILKVK